MDSSALVAILHNEPEASQFIKIIATAGGCLSSFVSLLETGMVLAGRAGNVRAWAGLDDLIGRSRMIVVPQDLSLVKHARQALLRVGKGRHAAALNLGDCASYALAKARDLPLLFRGNDFTRTDIGAAV